MADLNLLMRALERLDVLTVDEIDVLASLPLRTREFERGQELVREGDRPNQTCLIVAGFAARAPTLRNRKRQIGALHIPGDFVDLHSLLLKRMDHSVIAFSNCTASFIPHDALRLST